MSRGVSLYLDKQYVVQSCRYAGQTTLSGPETSVNVSIGIRSNIQDSSLNLLAASDAGQDKFHSLNSNN